MTATPAIEPEVAHAQPSASLTGAPSPETAIDAAQVVSPTARVAALARLTPDRAVFELAWPGIIEQFVRASGGLVVFAFIGHLGAVPTAAVGAAVQLTFLLFPVFMAVQTGTVALVSRRLGEGRPDEAAHVARQSLLLGAALALVTGGALALFAVPMLALFGATGQVAALAAPYLAIVGGLNVFQTVSIIGVAVMRAAGDTRTPMTLSLMGSALVIPATYLLLDVAGLGPIGAAYAQVAVGVLFMTLTLALLWRGRAGVSIAGGSWRVDVPRQRALLDISLPSMGESFLFSIGLIALGGLVIRLGTEQFAAHNLAIQLETLSFLPCIGFAGAAAALVGQSLGMRDPERARRSGWAAVRMAAVWTSALGVIFVLFPAQSLGIFTSDATVIGAGIGAVVVAGIGQPAHAFVFSLGGALRGAGDTRFTLALTTLNWFVVRLPLAILLGVVVGWGLTGVWVAILIDYGVRAGLMAWRFHSGAWARRAI